MRYIIIFLITVFVYAADSDFDGVPDKLDKCPNTPFLALVDKNGCMIKKLSITKYLIYIGHEKDFIKDKTYLTNFTGVTVYKNNFLFGGYISEYKIDKYHLNTKNVFLGIKKDKIKFKIKLYFPTYYYHNHYLSYYIKYYSIINISYEHQVRNLKNNDCVTVSKSYRHNSFYCNFYDYMYFNNSTNYIGVYSSYKISSLTSLSLNISTGTNTNKKNIYISSAINFFF
jgi:hypothetical protein